MRNAHCRTWNMVRKLTNKENEKLAWQDLVYSDKRGKMWKMRNVHVRTWNKARKMEKVENETHTLQDQEYGEKTDKRK